MAIPNTTPTPNIIFNGLMAKMTDTEFRIVMAVTRATLGWEIDPETKMRKKEDWLSYYQLKKITGRGYMSLSKAISSCIKKGWIEARDKDGNLLDTKNKRIGKKIYYRLGKEILLKNDGEEIVVKESQPLQKVERLDPTSPESVITESVITESGAYKRNTIQKKNFTKTTDKVLSGQKEKKSFRETKYPLEWYDQVLQEYCELKDLTPKGDEWNLLKREVKLMFQNGRTPEEIIKAMRRMAYIAEKNKLSWKLGTIRVRMPELLAGR